jgi:hypothetical protein
MGGGGMYQQCMQFCFKEQIGCNLEVHVDDIMIKSRKRCSLISDLEETFNNLHRFNIKLIPEKCTFGAPMLSSPTKAPSSPERSS